MYQCKHLVSLDQLFILSIQVKMLDWKYDQEWPDSPHKVKNETGSNQPTNHRLWLRKCSQDLWASSINNNKHLNSYWLSFTIGTITWWFAWTTAEDHGTVSTCWACESSQIEWPMCACPVATGASPLCSLIQEYRVKDPLHILYLPCDCHKIFISLNELLFKGLFLKQPSVLLKPSRVEGTINKANKCGDPGQFNVVSKYPAESIVPNHPNSNGMRESPVITIWQT